MAQTPRMAIRYIEPGQVSKEVTHNQGLERIDMAIQPVVSGLPSATPPGSASPGDCFLVGVGATGSWAGHDDAIAMMGDGGWVFLEAFEGLAVYDANSGFTRRYVGSGWQADALVGNLIDLNGDQVVGTRQGAIASPSGGSTKDTQARTAIDSLIAALAAHGLIASS